jgi:hypothetical protein
MTANKERSEVELRIGGKDRKLRYSLQRLAQLQTRFNGKPLLDIFGEIEKLNIEVIISLLHLGLLDDDKDLTEEQVSTFEDINITEVAQKIGQALTSSLGVKQGE